MTTELDQVEKAWHGILDAINSGASPDLRKVDRTAQFAQVESSLSIARSLESIAASLKRPTMGEVAAAFTAGTEVDEDEAFLAGELNG